MTSVYFQRKAQGKCPMCDTPKPPNTATVWCRSCLDKHAARKPAYAAKTREWNRNAARKKRAEGKCVTCGKPSPDGKAVCANCRAVSQQRIASRKAAGACLDCGKPAREGKQKCQQCADRENAKSARQVAAAIATGKCVRCRQQPSEPNRRHCAACRKITAEAARKYFATRNAEPLPTYTINGVEYPACRTCRKAPVDDLQYRKCFDCRKKSREKSARQVAAAIATGKCIRCRQQPSEPNRRHCAACRKITAEAARKYFATRNAEPLPTYTINGVEYPACRTCRKAPVDDLQYRNCFDCRKKSREKSAAQWAKLTPSQKLARSRIKRYNTKKLRAAPNGMRPRFSKTMR